MIKSRFPFRTAGTVTQDFTCPACHQDALQRRHRSTRDRLVALLAPSATPLLRYACMAPGCGWQGLLRGEPPSRPGYLPQQRLD